VQDFFNSYHHNYGTGTQPWQGNTNGVFAPGSTAYGIQDITDGTSNTICTVEALVGDFSNLNRPWRQMVAGVPGSVPANADLTDARQNINAVTQIAQQCLTAVKTAPGGNSNRGQRWQTGSPGLTLTSIIFPPNPTQFQMSACRWDCSSGCGTDFGHLFSQSSAHPGGVNTLFADGSVRFVKSSISQAIWMALATRNGGEVVSADAY